MAGALVRLSRAALVASTCLARRTIEEGHVHEDPRRPHAPRVRSRVFGDWTAGVVGRNPPPSRTTRLRSKPPPRARLALASQPDGRLRLPDAASLQLLSPRFCAQINDGISSPRRAGGGVRPRRVQRQAVEVTNPNSGNATRPRRRTTRRSCRRVTKSGGIQEIESQPGSSGDLGNGQHHVLSGTTQLEQRVPELPVPLPGAPTAMPSARLRG
jgi:hypothetical protein